jgi:hypothetical protein
MPRGLLSTDQAHRVLITVVLTLSCNAEKARVCRQLSKGKALVANRANTPY